MEIVYILVLITVLSIPTIMMYNSLNRYFKEQSRYNNHFLNSLFESEKRKKFFSFKQDYKKTSMPIITVKMFKHEYKFILDTGADFNALDREAFNKIVEENELTLPADFFSDTLPVMGGEKVFGVGGVENDVKQVNIPFSCGEEEFSEDFSIVNIGAPLRAYEDDGIYLCGVLGSPFFVENRWSLDFDEMTVWTNS